MKFESRKSQNMLKIGRNSFFQSKAAIEAEISVDAFYSADIHLKMLSTVISHIARCLANIGLAIYCLGNTVVRAFKEKSPGQAIEKGIYAVGYHLGAAGIDFVNIFMTLGFVAIRTVVSAKDGYTKPEGLVNRGLSKFDAFVEGQRSPEDAYNTAAALNFTG